MLFSVARICGLINWTRLPGSAAWRSPLPWSCEVPSWFPGFWFFCRLTHGFLKRRRFVVRGEGVEISLWSSCRVCWVHIQFSSTLCQTAVPRQSGAWVEKPFRLSNRIWREKKSVIAFRILIEHPQCASSLSHWWKNDWCVWLILGGMDWRNTLYKLWLYITFSS